MGVRLMRFSKTNSGGLGNTIAGDHDELINRDLANQHPIYAITGLQEILNILEDSIYETNQLILSKEAAIKKTISDIQSDIKDIFDAIKDIQDTISKLRVINKVEDTYSIDMDYDDNTKTLKADVKVYIDKDDTNAIQVLADGLYVPKTMTEETDSIKWTEESLGETLAEIYQNGIRFSHNSNSWSNVYSASEANAWYWDDNLQSFVQPQNTSYFTGFVTQNFYDYYTHKVTLRSTGGDNDVNGVVIGFVFDENGHPHTLTALCERVGWTGIQNWALVYDFYLPDQQVLFRTGNGTNGTTPGNSGGSDWKNLANGITVQITKYKNIITATCSDWNSTALNENTKITIDLNNYSWGYLFQGKVRYGYCNISQANSFFQNIEFLSDNQATSSVLLASVKVSQEPKNSLQIKEDGLYVLGMEVSDEEDNAAVLLEDGIYVRKHENIKQVTKETHGLTVGDFIYYHPNRGYQKALAIDDYNINIIGMVTSIIDADTFEYMWSGYFKTDLFDSQHDFVQGAPLYISDIDAGKVVQEQPDISKAVGYPVEDTGIIISIERGIQYNQEASIGDFKKSANTYNVRSDGFIKVAENIEYKLSLVNKLLDVVSQEFSDKYLEVNSSTDVLIFKNTEELYTLELVPDGYNLYIKAF